MLRTKRAKGKSYIYLSQKNYDNLKNSFFSVWEKMPLVAVQNNATTKVFADSIYVTKYFFRQIKEVPDFYVL